MASLGLCNGFCSYAFFYVSLTRACHGFKIDFRVICPVRQWRQT
ncbi:hypothetical protein SynA1544_01211 [Synechococcus sp. A15-44]|nr:hypothetical protein SynA1544_01211 [Synechococcus sp. A15-44]